MDLPNKFTLHGPGTFPSRTRSAKSLPFLEPQTQKRNSLRSDPCLGKPFETL